MAFPDDNGDVNRTKVFYSQAFGGGHTGTGAHKSNKRLVVGEIRGIWADTGIDVGNSGGPSLFGVSKLDMLKLQVTTPDGGTTYPDAEALPIANYDVVNELIFVVADEGAATPVNPAAGDTVIMRYLALGDDVEAPELT